jgi:LCP family protein required for cell wall assembly
LQEQKKRKKRRRRIARFVLLFLVIAAGVGYYGYNTYSSLSQVFSGVESNKSKLRTEEVEITKKPFSILFMGIEDYATDGENGRTDSLIFATINPKTKQVTMMSIPRDTRVSIAGTNKKSKINAAHAYGGEKMAVETVENFLKVPVDHYIKVDFTGFKQIVDVVGGVTVDVPFDFKERSDEDWYKEIHFQKGKQHLNGEEALAYVRMRKEDPMGDFGRAKRQRQLLTAVVSELSSASSVLKINDIAKVIGKYAKTDIPLSDGLALYKKFTDFDTSSIQNLNLEGKDEYIDGIYYFVPNEKDVVELHEKLRQNLGLIQPKESTSSKKATYQEENKNENK